MRLAVMLVVLSIGGIAYAQPGAAPPPPPQPYPPPPYQYQPGVAYPVQLSPEDQELLMDGEISDGAAIGGAVASIFIGYGSGQAIQGRWSDTGWIFTLGETASTAAMIAGVIRTADDCSISDCNHSDGPPLIIVGALGFTVFHVWGIVDAFAGPGEHNRRVRDLKYRLGIPVRVGVAPYVNKSHDGATAGLTFSF